MQVASVASPAGDAAASAKALLSILSSRLGTPDVPPGMPI